MGSDDRCVDNVCKHCDAEITSLNRITFECGCSYHRNCPKLSKGFLEASTCSTDCRKCWRVCGHFLKKGLCKNWNKGKCTFNHVHAAVQICNIESPAKRRTRPFNPRELQRRFLKACGM